MFKGPPSNVTGLSIALRRTKLAKLISVSWNKSFSLVSNVWYIVTIARHRIGRNTTFKHFRTNSTTYAYSIKQHLTHYHQIQPTCDVYDISVAAVNPAGSSAPSNTISQNLVSGMCESVQNAAKTIVSLTRVFDFAVQNLTVTLSMSDPKHRYIIIQFEVCSINNFVVYLLVLVNLRLLI